jgi:hypothetical protein
MGRAAIAPLLGEATARPFSGRLATDDLGDRPRGHRGLCFIDKYS